MTCTPDIQETWPADPYKGFGYYTFEDLPLFTGREDDVDACVAYLAEPRTRTLLLHGRTGCGKSSFLRAGLIPALEERGFGYVFLRRAPDEQPVFIRCTADPMARIAEEIFRFTEQPFRVKTAIDTREIDLSSARMGFGSIGAFVHACHDPNILLEVLQAISEKCLRTIVIILDQAEEAISQADRQSTFFDFLKLFNATTLRVKLLIALRTERFGEFFDFVHLDASIHTDVKQYFLRALDRGGVKRAIEFPTLKEPLRGGKSPYEAYGFRFDEGPGYSLIDEIVEDLFEAPPSGGILPLMQIVCRSLYNDVSHLPSPRIITEQLYHSGGGLAGRVDMQIGAALGAAIRKAGLPPFVDVSEQARKWRSILYRLVRTQPDGTVISDVLDEAALLSMLKGLGTLKQVQSILAELSDPRVLLLRRFDVTTAATGLPITLYSLGHDAIGLALRQWFLREEEATKGRRAKRYFTVGALALLGALFFFVYQFNEQRLSKVDWLQWYVEANFRSRPHIAANMAINASVAASDIWWGKTSVNPNSTLAQIAATLPETTIRPNLTQPVEGSPSNRTGYPLPQSRMFAFWNPTNGAELVSWDGKKHIAIEPSALHGKFVSKKVLLANVTEAAPGVILFRFDLPDDTRNGFITIVKDEKVVAINDLQSFVNSSQLLKGRLDAMAPILSLENLRVDGNTVALIISANEQRWVVVEDFVLGEDLLFRQLGAVEYREPHYNLPIGPMGLFANGFVLLALTQETTKKERGDKVLSDLKLFDAKTKLTNQVWSLGDLKESAAKHCRERPINFFDSFAKNKACVVFLIDSFIVIKVPEQDEYDKATLVIVDSATGHFVDIPWVATSIYKDAPFLEQREPTGFNDATIFVSGVDLPMFIAVSDGDAMFDVFRVHDDGVPNFVGTYFGRLRGNKLNFAPDGASMALVSDSAASSWNLSKSWETRVQELEKKHAATLIKQICDARLPAPSDMVPSGLPVLSNPCKE